jgi:hypothetical protein
MPKKSQINEYSGTTKVWVFDITFVFETIQVYIYTLISVIYITLLDVALSLVSQNPREYMFLV